MGSTAHSRELAQTAEKLLDWRMAAIHWKQAVVLYPAGVGELRARDIAWMQERAESCLAMARSEEQRRRPVTPRNSRDREPGFAYRAFSTPMDG